jgi:predicted amidophosphoribosyltransferase
MFRCVTNLKGLVIDIDSFEKHDFEDWTKLVDRYSCIFVSENSRIYQKIVSRYGRDRAILYTNYSLRLAPNKNIHGDVIKHMQLKSTEIAYVSASHQFVINALKFFSGSIWIHKTELSYNEMSFCPDIVCDSIIKLADHLCKSDYGIFGEINLYPFDDKVSRNGFVLPISWQYDGKPISVYSAGRYFGYSHYMSQLHPYSSAIYFNKKEESKSYKKFNGKFAAIISRVVSKICSFVPVECICNVPVRPNSDDRFEHITQIVASDNNLENISKRFRCVYNYPKQKNLSAEERYNNVKNAFEYSDKLNGKNVILIDDIMTTGSTVRACCEKLTKCGAESVIVVVLAVNQIDGSYWSTKQPFVSCPTCKQKMKLHIRSNELSFFYSCPNRNGSNSYHKTLNFEDARKFLVDEINAEFDYNYII